MRPMVQEIEIREIKVASLGEQKYDSQLASGMFLRHEVRRLRVPVDMVEHPDDNRNLRFEVAGPRKKLYFDPKNVKSAIVTCGGLCPGLNDVIRAIVLESHYAYGSGEIYGIRYGLAGFIEEYGYEPVMLTPANVDSIHCFGGTMLGSSRGVQDMGKIVEWLVNHEISILYVIGGDGSMKAAQAIAQAIRKAEQKIAVVGIPKTIDNDINFVPMSFGFDTAVAKASEAVACAHVEALGGKNTIGLVKLMGRESGFIAAQTALSMRDVNFVLVPELPFEMDGEDGFLARLHQRIISRSHAVIVVAEGAGQHLLSGTGKYDLSGNAVLSDIAQYLQSRIKAYFMEKGTQVTIKYIDPSYIIRSVPANKYDASYCGLLGQNAVHAAMAGRTEMIVSKIMDEYVHVPLEIVTAKRRKMDPQGELWRAVLESTGEWNVRGMRPYYDQD